MSYNYYNFNISFTSKTNWNVSDIVDLQDYNRVKNNINILLDNINSFVGSSSLKLTISEQVNQIFNVEKANELEKKLKEYLLYLGNLQWNYNVSGLTTTGNNFKLGGVS